MPLRFRRKKRSRDKTEDEGEAFVPTATAPHKQDEQENIGPGANRAGQRSTTDVLRPTFSQELAAQKSRVDHVTRLAEKLMADKHPDVGQVTDRQEQLKQEWKELKDRYEAHKLKYYFKDTLSTQTYISTKLAELRYGSRKFKNLAAVEAEQEKLAEMDRQIKGLQDRVHSLKKDATALSEEHEDQAAKINSAHAELASKVATLTERVAERKLELEHAHSLHVFLDDFTLLVGDMHGLRMAMAEGDVKELKEKGEHLAELMERGERLEDMLGEAEGLAVQAQAFAKTSKEIRKKEKKNCCIC